MRYVILRHQVPAGRVEAHLEFHVGSIDEQENQRGMAHMLEHVCFLGSERRMQLQSGGLGMTSNACTDFNHTVYHLSLGTEYLSQGLEALADIGFNPAFRPERVEKERAAVLSEAQMVNDVQYRLQTQFLTAMHKDNPIHVRFPIGLEHQIANWTVEDLQSFHIRWYVPENATLFIVGDVDEDIAVEKVEQTFNSISSAGLATGQPWDLDATSLLRPAIEGRPRVLHSFVEPIDGPEEGAPALKDWSTDLKVNVSTNDLLQGMQIAWAAKMPMVPARTVDDLSEWLCQRLVVEAVRLRFSARWRSGVIPCTLHSYDTAREAVSITSLTIMTEPNRWKDRCEEVLQEILAISSHGLAQEELDLAKRMTLDRVKEAADAQPWAVMGTLKGYEAAGTSREVVDAMIASFPGSHLLTEAPAFSQALVKAAEEIDLARFNQAVKSTLGYFGGSAAGGAANARGSVIVSCPATVTEELTGRKVPFTAPTVEEVESVLRNIDELDESEVAERRVSAPASLAPAVGEKLPEPLEVLRAASSKEATTLRLANGLVVRLLVMPASPSSGPARGGLRLTVPGGRASDEIAGRMGASRAMLHALDNCAVGEWSQEEVQLFRALNSVQTDFKAGTDALELDVFFPPTAASCRAALEWLHWALKEPQFNLQGFADAQLRMKGDTTFREKSLEGASRQALLERMYPSHRWLDEAAMLQVNQLTLGLMKKAAQEQLGSVAGLELDLVVCIPSHASAASGLMHEESFEEASDAPVEEEEAIAEMRKMLEREVCRCLGSLPSSAGDQEAFQAPTPSASSRGAELRVHLPDKEARAMVMVGGTAPGYWGRAAPSFQVTTESPVAEPPTMGKSRHGPMVCGVGSLLVVGVVFMVSTSVPRLATGGNQRSLSDAMAPQLASTGCCRFAKEFEDADWYNPQTRSDFMANVMRVERRFFGEAAALAFDPDTGMTYDGVGLDYQTGDVQHETLRTFSAPSKEALHLSLLALALQPADAVPAELATVLPLLYSSDEALDILEKKARTMEDFDARFPGFGGFMPWFCSRGINEAGYCKTLTEPGARMTPVSGWEKRLPGLDNGQLAFGTVAVVHALKRRATQEGASSRFAQLARRWEARLERMKASVVSLFYNGAGLVRMVSELDNITVDVAKNASNAHNENGLFLWDAFEGEMIVLFMDIFGNWTKYPNNGEEDRKMMWTIKAEHVEPVVYTAADNTKMVLQKGYWFSAHEQWKTLQLPYMDIPLVRHLFANGEFARLENSVQQELPGLMASVNAPNGVQCDAHPYCSAVGIQALAEEPVFSFKEDTVLTPYAAFPSILVDSAAGLAWYNHMLAMPRVQTPVGSIESFTDTGKAVAPMATWDAKATTILAMLGGTGPLLRKYMQEQGVYAVFEDRVKSMYGPVFEPVIAAVMPNKASIDKHIAQLPKLPLPAPHPTRKDSLPEDFPSCRGDETWQRTARYKGFSWGPRAEQDPLYPARATQLMMECLNARLLGRAQCSAIVLQFEAIGRGCLYGVQLIKVRDQLSLTYNCEALHVLTCSRISFASLCAQVASKLTAALGASNCVVEDKSGGCGQSFTILIESEKFRGQTKLKCQRMVQEVIREEIAQWHAVSIQTKVPE
ncbi:SPP [Symbiodinium sp. KB8]|nr:SPP [Symbiodinium sp. KB8]